MNTVYRSDLERIRSSSSIDDKNMNQTSHLSRKELLKQKNDSRVAHWGDTLAAKRRTRLEWKSEKAKKEEESQRALDAQEARLKERARINLLQHADNLRMEHTEKVRNFRSQQLLVETLNGRNEQIMQKEARRKELMKEEELWHRTVMNDIQNSERKRDAELKQNRLKSIELAQDLSKQRLEREQQLQIENHSKQREEKLIITQIIDENRAAEKAELLQRINRRENAKAEMHQNKMILRQKRELQLKQEQEESQRCAKELEKRISMSVARAQLEDEHFRQKQATRKVLSDRASHDLKERAEREFEIFERDQHLKHQRELKEAEKARKKQELAQIEIDKCRKEQLYLKKQQLEADRQLNKLYMEERERITKDQIVAEQNKEFSKRKLNIECRKSQEKQAQENAKRKAEEEAKRLNEELEALKVVRQEHDIFAQFALQEIERFQAKGCTNTHLLKETLNARID